MMEIIRYSGHPTNISIFFNSILILMAFIFLNSILRRVRPSLVFSQAELLTIYIMVNITSALVSHDFIQVLIPVMIHPFQYANPTNQWETIIIPYLKPWLTVSDPETVEGFYSGNDVFLHWANLKFWLVPLAAWGSFIVVMVGSMLCLVTLLRKQWTENEKLAYPLVQLPLDMTSEKSPLFRNKLMWIGFAVAAGINIWNGFAYLNPQIPPIPIKHLNYTDAFTTRPWNAWGWFPVHFYPFALGLGILLPLDLSFSCWFFFLFWKMQRIMTAAYGWDATPGFPFANEQAFGAYMGIAIFAIWASRKHFAAIIRSQFGRGAPIDDSREPFSYRLAFWGFIAGVLYMVGFAVAAGMGLVIAVVFFIFYWLLALAITRMRAELGPPAHDLHDAGPDRIVTALAGPNRLDDQSLTALAQFFWFNRAYRSHPMPFQLEGFKLGERADMSFRRLGVAMMLAVVVGTIAAFWAVLSLTYEYGAAARVAPPIVPIIYGFEPYSRLEAWLTNPLDARANTAGAVGFGFALTILLNALRMQFSWFPFHPVGYAVSGAWSMSLLWICLFLAWLIKLIILRYGGLKLYRQLLPFFMGLILGECVVGGAWTLIGIYLDIPTYAFWP